MVRNFGQSFRKFVKDDKTVMWRIEPEQPELPLDMPEDTKNQRGSKLATKMGVIKEITPIVTSHVDSAVV